MHLFYAGLFAFVLPLICWGAQATPGHPHARAHFVFLDPPGQAHVNQPVVATIADVDQWLADFGRTILCTADQHKAPVPATEPAQIPTGRSVPAQMGSTLLNLIGIATSARPMNADGPGFHYWLTSLRAAPFIAPILLPPPRA